jgi:hypothetical protein
MTKDRMRDVCEWMYRAMRAAADGLPEAGATARTLGARPGPGPGTDISVIGGRVQPGPHGMSVTMDDPTLLPKVRKPRSMGGDGRDPLFRMRA